ncbi:MAG: hypothetical protein IPN74_20145 [Haliscomenobacter sp.]|nr:hypothetical protein [Haliscomenobacter sp.]
MLLFNPYHLASGIPFTNNWDLRGIQTAVHLEGTLNELPDGTDSCWTVEMAIPLQALAELTTGKSLLPEHSGGLTFPGYSGNWT